MVLPNCSIFPFATTLASQSRKEEHLPRNRENACSFLKLQFGLHPITKSSIENPPILYLRRAFATNRTFIKNNSFCCCSAIGYIFPILFNSQKHLAVALISTSAL